MKKIVKIHIILLVSIISMSAMAQVPVKRQGNYVEILPTDSQEEIVKKAANITPSTRQMTWQEMEFTGFICFGINTFTDREWGTGKENPDIFNPTQFDARQWCKVAKDAGMKLLLLTCKHHDGFCLWPSKYTDFSVASSPWKDGKGDVVKELADACKEFGLKLGVYLSPWDRNSTVYGTDKYNDYFVNQLTELLTNYGEVAEVWFDGACGEGPNGKKQIYDWQRYYQTIRRLQPNAVIAIMGPDVRWVGTESGYGRDTEWSVVPAMVQDEDIIAAKSQQKAGTFRPEIDAMAKDLGSREKLLDAKRLVWYPSEVDVSIRPGWYYHANQDSLVKSPEKLIDIYYNSVGKNSLLLLNLPPDKRGLIHENDIKSLMEMKKIIDETFKVNLAAGATIKSDQSMSSSKIKILTDGDFMTYWMAKEETPVIEIILNGKKTFDCLLLQEKINIGQRVEKFKFEAKIDGVWKLITDGTTIGYKRLLRFPEITTDEIRFSILQSRTNPALTEIGIYKSASTNK